MKSLAMLAAAALLVGFATLGCGLRNGGGGLTLEEYFQKIDEVQNNNDATFATQEASQEEPSADATGEELAAFLRDSITESADVLRNSAADADDIDPPDEVADPHDDIVAALNDAVAALDGLADSVPDTLTLADLAEGTFFDSDDLNAAFDSLAAACNTLEGIATANDITVDLACDEV
jgi:hypothetical protein